MSLHHCPATNTSDAYKYNQLTDNELPSDKSSGSDSGSDDEDPFWQRHRDNHYGRQEDQRWRRGVQSGRRRDDQHGRRDNQHGRRDDQHGRRDNQHGRRDDQHGRRDDQHGRRDDKRGQWWQDGHGHRGLLRSHIKMPSGGTYSISLPISTESGCDVNTKRIPLNPNGRMGRKEYTIVKREMENTMTSHAPSLFTVDVFSRYEIIKIEKLVNGCLWNKYRHRRWEIKSEAGFANERMLFHGSANVNHLVDVGFDERYASMNGLFGAGLYFASNSSKSDQYVFGGTGCPEHGDLGCHNCERQMLLCRVILGKMYRMDTPKQLAHPPPESHSVMGIPGGMLEDPEYIVYRGEQVYPEYLITYKTKA